MNFFPIPPPFSLTKSHTTLCIKLAKAVLCTAGLVLIKFRAEASLELCEGRGGKYVNGLLWKQRLLIKDAAGRCPSNLMQQLPKRAIPVPLGCFPRTKTLLSIKHKFYDATFFFFLFFIQLVIN